MFHYVRDLRNSRFPKIKGLDLLAFRYQIDFLSNNFNVVSCYDVIKCLDNNDGLPENSVLLTFDDGYIDHYVNVFPILKKYGISGVFSMPGKIIAESKLLNVNKIDFLLASTEESALLASIYDLLDFYRGNEFAIPTTAELYFEYACANRFDSADVVFIKKMLQTVLDEKLRNMMIDRLFKKHIDVPEKTFAKELYMNIDQVKFMKDSGMEFGCHGYEHYWLGNLPIKDAKNDIKKSLETFSNIIDTSSWMMCFPYGSYSEELLSYCGENGCALGFSTQVRTANLNTDRRLILPRLDTNDFPPKSLNYLEN